ncbi:amidohydrolase [uncultured Roseobacter sp.]|uniref:amidohydrolase n=1 Tax=uncultured Roseobacter sp. TaxID=114847 RepID=UPI0026198B8C|nr:amidohydrolase [uncultured Roseobacter sp.]
MMRLALLLTTCLASAASAQDGRVDMILTNGKIVTLDHSAPEVSALAIDDGIIVATGSDADIATRANEETEVIDLGGRTAVPGLNDSHSHVVRGGRFYNTELRWDGVGTLARGIEMIAEQAARTPGDQWVRVIGGWSPFQFEEGRMPTPAELTEAAPDVPVFVLYLYSQGFLNAAAVEALEITEDTEAPPGGRYEITEDGGAILHAEPNPTILYQTIGALPGLSEDDQENSTRHFYRELNRFGITSAVDAGGGGHVFPDDYIGSQRLADMGDMPVRVSNYLFPQRPGEELADFETWTENWAVNVNMAEELSHGFVVEGAGEFLVWSAGDFENWMAEMPDITTREGWREELMAVTRHLLQQRWPIRIHATYDQSIGHIMDVFEEAHRLEREAGRSGFAGIRWAIDHAETVSRENLARIAALGGGVAVQARLAYAGEYFVDRYGAAAAENAPPLRDMIEMGIPIGGGTDATRVASYNPWVALHWLVTGETVGGMPTRSERHQLNRIEALEAYTVDAAWFSGEEARKGRIAPGQYADIAVLTADYFTVPEDEIADLESVLTITAGKIVYGTEEFADRAPQLPAISPDWSPAVVFGGYARQ